MYKRAVRTAELCTLAALVVITIHSICWAGPPAPPQLLVGTPGTVASSGSYYSFTPTVDGAGGTLTFSIINKPDWADFDSATGTLSGTPSGSGLFDGIQIMVNDGATTTALAPFSINVASTRAVPVMDGVWLLPGMLAACGILMRRRRA